jgi:putative Mg2+ transporter-C (MgtC) family protein
MAATGRASGGTILAHAGGEELDWQLLFNTSEIPEAIIKLLLASVLGAVLGFEREIHGEVAGFRTYILVAMGSCLIMMVSIHLEILYRPFGSDTAVRVDPGRIASYALAGMGFLGAGAIIVGRGHVRGLTTAAGLWMITAVGLAVGSGYLLPAVFGTVLALFVLFSLRQIRHYFHRDISSTIMLAFGAGEGDLDGIEGVMAKYPNSRISFVSFHRRLESGTVTYRLNIISKEGEEWRDLTRDLAQLPGLREIGLEEAKLP